MGAFLLWQLNLQLAPPPVPIYAYIAYAQLAALYFPAFKSVNPVTVSVDVVGDVKVTVSGGVG